MRLFNGEPEDDCCKSTKHLDRGVCCPIVKPKPTPTTIEVEESCVEEMLRQPPSTMPDRKGYDNVY